MFLGWPSHVDLSVLVTTDNFVLCSIKQCNFLYFVVLLYGSTAVVNRSATRDALHYAMHMKTPILILGDFNQIEYSCQKKGGRKKFKGVTSFAN